MRGLTYDTGALLAAEAGRRELWALHNWTLQHGRRPVVPAGVLGQAWRGGPQARLSRLLQGCRVEDLDEMRSRRAGVMCARAGMSDVIDASVVVGAISRDDTVVTSDADDMLALARALRRPLTVHRV
jgi:hypothetical protein